MKFRKKPVVIEAVQWTGRNLPEVLEFVGNDLCRPCSGLYVDNPRVVIGTMEGCMEASEGDWIIRGVKGECYPCKPDVFSASYEAVLE